MFLGSVPCTMVFALRYELNEVKIGEPIISSFDSFLKKIVPEPPKLQIWLDSLPPPIALTSCLGTLSMVVEL